VARHLAASVEAANADPELSWEHARAALSKASRVGIVREVAAESAYHAGHFAEALTEFRAARRMRGIKEYWPLMADCERALGRPAKAIAMAADPLVASLDRGSKVEMRIVASGARVDQGKLEAALATLQCPDLTTTSTEPWAVRIRYAYADVLEKLGRDAEALEWFHRAAAVDVEDQTDANDRIARLEGVVYEEVEEFDDYEDEDEDETSETEEFSDDE
jgi:tetratricopeptide (TPR) repeat protein